MCSSFIRYKISIRNCAFITRHCSMWDPDRLLSGVTHPEISSPPPPRYCAFMRHYNSWHLTWEVSAYSCFSTNPPGIPGMYIWDGTWPRRVRVVLLLRHSASVHSYVNLLQFFPCHLVNFSFPSTVSRNILLYTYVFAFSSMACSLNSSSQILIQN